MKNYRCVTTFLTQEEYEFLTWSLNDYIENSLSESENNKSQIYQIQEILDNLNPQKETK